MAAPKWDDLRIFLAVARGESLSAAGRALALDPATVGRRIARLEADLKARLFVKSPQGYGLTEAGQRLLDRAGTLEGGVSAALDAVRGSGDRLTGAVRIGAPDGSANYLLPQVCAAISDAHPGLELQIVALPRIFNLSKREADMAITVSPPRAGRLTVQRLTDYHLHLAASGDYLEAHPPIGAVSDLRVHRIIGYIPDMIFDTELDYLDELGPGLRPALSSNSVAVQINWARAGAGVCIVHDFALPAAPGLSRILTDQFSLRRSFYLVRHADDGAVGRFNRVALMLAQGLRDEVARLEALA